MIKLKDSQISQILPEYLSGRTEVKALSFALYRAVERLVEYCRNVSVFAVIDMAPSQLLDMLALELNTQYYDESLPIDSKRKLVKNTMVWYMSAGTPQAVEELVTAVFGGGKLEEWFEYGGQPFYFRVLVDADYINEENIKEFIRMISTIKNARSRFGGIWLKSDIDNSALNDIRLYNVCSCMRMPFYPFRLYDGAMPYDGTARYDAKRSYRLGVRLGLHCEMGSMKEEISNLSVEIRRNEQYYNGKKHYDGTTKYNAMIRRDKIE